MDPLTGLSRRSVVALVVVVVGGIAASTVATLVEAQMDPECSDPAYGCAVLETGDPLYIGVLVSGSGAAGRAAVGDVWAAVEADGGRLLSHPIEVIGFGGACSAQAGADGARNLSREMEAVAMIASACAAATIPSAQILNDSGVSMLSDGAVPLPPQVGRTRFYLTRTGDPAATAELVLGAVQEVAVAGPDGLLLIPRTPLRDALVDAGASPVA